MSDRRKPLITVVLPTHNRAHIIGISLASVLAQTYENLEAIVVDDASTDNTPEVISGMADCRVKYLRLDEKKGAAAARNKGTSIASGEFVFFQDSDDIWLPDKIERQLTSYYELASHHRDVVGGFCRYVRLCGRTSSVLPPGGDLAGRAGRYHEVILSQNVVGAPTLMVRTDVLRSSGGFDESLSTDEDWDLALTLTKDNRLSFTDEILVCSTTSADGVSKRPRAVNILKVIEKHMDSFAKNRRTYSAALAAAASDFLENGDEIRAICVARRSLGIRPSLKGLLLGVWPRSYTVLNGVKERLRR